jgi:outer membrane protein assembly factor BamA
MSAKTILLALAFTLAAIPPLYSQTTQRDSTQTSDSTRSSDTASKSTSGIVAAPYIKYAPETGLVLGASELFYFRIFNDATPGVEYRPSSISGGITYSTRNQLSTGMDYTLYMFNDKIYVFGGFDYKRIPFDFYGVGNGNPESPTDSYTPLWVGGDCLVTYNILRTEQGEGLSAGICSEDRHDNILSSNAGGPLQTDNVPGAKGGVSAGLGAIVTYDTRDNVFSSHTGNFVDFRAVRYSTAIGGSFNFTRITLDTRTFVPVHENHTFAMQGLLTLATDGEPFYTMAQLGGDNNMRGYAEGRFRSNDMAVFQAEYRLPVWWRFGLCGFAGIGEVGSTMNDFTYYGIKFAGGAGIRFTVSEAERLVVRLDYGIGNNSSELYLQVMEAF